jgi:hypothetical protein
VDENERLTVAGLQHPHGDRRVSQPHTPARDLRAARLEQLPLSLLECCRSVHDPGVRYRHVSAILLKLGVRSRG